MISLNRCCHKIFSAIASSGFVLALILVGTPCCAGSVSCPVATTHIVSEQEQEFLRGHFDAAAGLYQAALQKSPGDPALIAGLTNVLLRQQKVSEADSLVSAASAQNVNSAVLYTSMGDVQYREGTPWLAAESATKAAKIDPCYPQLHLLNAKILRLNSSYASAAKELNLAHSLDPHDPDIRQLWVGTLPLSRRIAELEAYLGGETGDDPDDLRHMRGYLDSLKKQAVEPHKACRLVSDKAVTEIPFATMMRDAKTIRAFGLDVKLNDRNARLEIDTGASGLVINRSVAEHAHLQRFSNGTSAGIGDKGERASYTAYADSIRIGGLEFHDCEVEVIDSRNTLDIDGLIGMDVFSNFLVTLDFPMRKLVLGTLPKRPEEMAAAKPTLETAKSESRDEDSGDEEASAKPPAPDTKAAQTVPMPARGPHDRYIAPEMKDWTRVYRNNHNLIIPTLLNDSPPKLFILDTGAFATTVSPAVARAVTKVRGGSAVKVKGISGEVDKVSSADSIVFKFGNLSQKVQDVVVFDTPAISKYTGMEIAGFIGATTLGQVAMSIDYRDGLVKFAYDANRGYRYPGVPQN